MYARVTTIEGSTDQIDEGIDRIREMTLPLIKEIDGFKGICSLVDRQTGKGVTITLWDNEGALQASEEQANRIRRDAAENLGATAEPTVDRYEVAIYEVASPVTA